jgi:hypothetical protein
MTRPARRGSSLPVDVVAVARCTVAMAWVCVGELDLRRVTRRTECCLCGGGEVVRTMARRACRSSARVSGAIGRREVPVALRAPRHDGRRGRGGMRLVAGDARILRTVLHRDTGVAALARCCGGGSHVPLVRRVTGRAFGVLRLGRRQRGLVAMTTHTGRSRRRHELVRLVATLARRVAGRTRASRFFMASRA